MKSFNNELTVHSGETFSIDRTIQNKNGSPYIVSNRLTNPYMVLSISTTRYDQKDRYVINYWMDLKNVKKFKATVPFDLKSLKRNSEIDGIISESKYPNGFSDIKERTLIDGVYYVATGYIGDTLVFLEDTDCVFFVEDDNGNIQYKYWDSTIKNGREIGWKEYFFRFVKIFDKDITKDWIEQSYTYSINIVAGTSTYDYITNLCVQNNLPLDTLQKMYESLLNIGIIFPDNFDITRPLATIDTSMPILIPTKMSVLSSINGGKL